MPQPQSKRDAGAPIVKRKTKKFRTAVTKARAYIQATYNNTLITITDDQGNALAWSSSGHVGFKGPKKSTPFAAGIIVRDVMEKVQHAGIREVAVFVKGVGSGREAAIRALGAQGLTITSIKDITPIPHNGPRAKKTRRV